MMNQGLATALLLSLIISLATNLQAQPPAGLPPGVTIVDGKPVFPPGMKPPTGRPPGGKKGQPEKPGEKKEDNKNPKKEDGKTDDAVKPIKRPTKSDIPFDQKILDAQRPNENRMVRLNVQGAPWLSIINWLGDISGMSVDWQELPGDVVNLRTHRDYKIEEMRNIINRHLLARGYTMLINGELLTVEKVATINKSLVPRFSPDQLTDHLPYEFAKTSFALQSLIAEDVVKELESMISKNGKITSLANTNRIEVMDTVANLTEIHQILQAEQQGAAHSQSVREFVLKNVTATLAASMIRELMGIKSSSGGNSNPMAAMMAQQQRMRGGHPGQQPGQQPKANAKEKPKPTIIVNERRNSIVASATPDKMAVIEQAIRLIDVQAPQNSSLDRYLSRLRTYRLVTLDPNEVVEILHETGVMDPTTMLKVDEKSKSIIANAPPWDHLTIEKMIKKLDGAAREFRVVRLRRRRADQVATTIETLMVGEKEDNNSRNRFRFWGFQPEEKKDPDKFRVAADIEHNWLLVWCNDNEYDKVKQLLEELGEITDGSVDRFRVLENFPTDIDDDTLEQLRRAFERAAPNELKWEIEKDESKEKESEDKTLPKKSPAADDDVVTSTDFNLTNLIALNDSDDADEATNNTETGESRTRRVNQPRKRPPIRVLKDPNGRVVIESEDPAALDLFEELASQIIHTKKDFTVFKLKYASPTLVALTLEEFFDDQSDDSDDRFPFFFFGMDDNRKDDKPLGLGDRRELLFVSDLDSQTIVVRNATASQLRTIKELIDLYDIQEPLNTDRARYTRTIHLEHAKARDVADTIKGAFTDLLSKNDEAFRKKEEGNNNRNRNPFQRQEESNQTASVTSLQGKLAIGVNEPSNLLVLSTQGEKLMEVVTKTIMNLDEAAKDNEVSRVVRIKSSTPNDIHETLLGLVGAKKDEAPKENNQQPNQPNPNQQPNENRQNNSDNRGFRGEPGRRR